MEIVKDLLKIFSLSFIVYCAGSYFLSFVLAIGLGGDKMMDLMCSYVGVSILVFFWGLLIFTLIVPVLYVLYYQLELKPKTLYLSVLLMTILTIFLSKLGQYNFELLMLFVCGISFNMIVTYLIVNVRGRIV